MRKSFTLALRTLSSCQSSPGDRDTAVSWQHDVVGLAQLTPKPPRGRKYLRRDPVEFVDDDSARANTPTRDRDSIDGM